jgi:hypothetical protein
MTEALTITRRGPKIDSKVRKAGTELWSMIESWLSGFGINLNSIERELRGGFVAFNFQPHVYG